MKKHTIIIVILLATLSFGCKKSFLNQLPQTALTVPTTFINYTGFQTYAWSFYSVFPGYGTTAVLTNDVNSDLFLISVAGSSSNWIWQRIIVPLTDANYSTPYANIRSINIMLDNIDNSSLSTVDKNHWRSVGYFFRAYNYMNLLNLYGDVPYIYTTATDTSTAVLYQPRASRDVVAQNILNELTYAAQNIKAAGDGANTINTNVVLALISRFGLREGTWRKYHALANANTYLQASADASAKLMTAFPTLQANYDLDFNSSNLAGAPGIILYKYYALNQIMNGFATDEMGSGGPHIDLTKAAADLFLMTDGQTRFTSPLFAGDHSPFTEFRNRDKRLYYIVPPPYKVTIPNATSTTYTPTSNPADAEYFPVMAGISDPMHKTLPTVNEPDLLVVGQEPNFKDAPANGQANTISTYTGYRFYKFANRQRANISAGQSVSNAPIFRMGEVLANYAEAMYELGLFTQTVADQTVNKLRDRGGVAHLDLSNIPNDPTRDAQIAPALWEIRRERAVELMGEGFRYDDLRRWKKMDYATNIKLGRYITKGVDVPSTAIIPILNGASAGYISYEGQPPVPWPDYYYLYPIPTQEITLNPKIKQNPGW
jgi:hypothetical protein